VVGERQRRNKSAGEIAATNGQTTAPRTSVMRSMLEEAPDSGLALVFTQSFYRNPRSGVRRKKGIVAIIFSFI
jgi:hypothetical protein